MRILLIHHPSDASFVASLVPEMARRDFDRVEAPAAADLAVLLVSRAALEQGLGEAPRQALDAGLELLPLLLGEDVLPARFPVHRKHTPLCKDVAGVLKVLVENRKQRGAKQIDGKSEVFGYGVLLGLLARKGR
ncbi:MAG: hypothetical protein ACKOCB_05535 [Planctomycetia bacterium]